MVISDKIHFLTHHLTSMMFEVGESYLLVENGQVFYQFIIWNWFRLVLFQKTYMPFSSGSSTAFSHIRNETVCQLT